MAALREVFARFSTQFQTTQLERGEAQIERVTASLGKLGIALGVGLAVRATANFVDGIREAGDELDKTGIVLGTSTADLQRFRFAANLAGVENGDFSNSMIRMQRMMSDAANGMTAPKEAFEDLGISVTNAQGEVKGISEIMPEFAQAIAEIESPAERVGALNRLMGRSGARLGPMFAQGAAGLSAAADQFDRLGGGLSQEAIDAGVELTDAYTELDVALTSLKSTIGLFIIPILIRLTDTMSDFLSDTSKVEAMKATLAALAGVITVHLAPALIVLTSRFIALAAPFAPLIVAGGLLFLILEDIFTAMEGGESVSGDLMEALRDGAVMLEGFIMDQFNAFLRLVGELDQAFQDFFSTNRQGDGVLGTITRTWERLISAASRLMSIVGGDGDPGAGGGRRASRGMAGAGGGSSTVAQTNNVTINTGADQASVERALERTNRRNNRHALENLEARTA